MTLPNLLKRARTVSAIAGAAACVAVLGFLVVNGIGPFGMAASAAGGEPAEGWSPTEPYPVHNVYYPGTEALDPDEMRVISCGTGMPMMRMKQAAACFLIELGNGDKFIFDMGTGSLSRIESLGIPLDYLDKVFLTHLHMDHAGDFPALVLLGPQNNRSVPIRVWGPGGGGSPEDWGTQAFVDNVMESWAWMMGTLRGTIDTSSFAAQVTEFDWSKVNNVIYDENGVVIRSIPAIHFEQSVSLILEWNGLKLAFSGDTMPNRWWVEHTQNSDISIHEAFFPPALASEKWGFTDQEALNAVTTIHSTAAFFGKVMDMTRPRRAVAYHFQNDADTLPAMIREIESLYDGPVDYAQDFMVWNVTEDDIRVRMVVVNPEAYPSPPLHEKQIEADEPYQTPQWVLDGWLDEVTPVAEAIYSNYNAENGTEFQFPLSK